MAIDSRAKRASLVGIVPFLAVGVTNDGTPDQGWRQAAGWGYFGILASGGAGPTFVAARASQINVLVLRAGR